MTPIGVVGAGRVAGAFGKALTARGWRVVSIDSRAPIRADTGILLIAVSDDALARVAGSLALAFAATRGVALHTSGSHSPEVLAPLAAIGFDCGTLHPLQTLSGGGADPLQGVAFAISGGERAMAVAAGIVKALDGTPLRIRPERRAAYHAGAVMASNYVTALIHAAVQLFQLAGIGETEARRALAPLIRQSVENTLDAGPAQSLTGPIRRGDAGTVAAHLAALDSTPESLQLLYRACGMYTVDVAREGGLTAGLASEIEKLLKCKTH
jgi:predicted short-subunit dehydrogenase-like oxidoreductase (DUF2520 family)